MLSPKQSGVLECHLSHISKNENYELCILAGFFVTTKQKKVLVVCLGGAQSILRPEKKSSSHLSGQCAIVITTGKKSSSHLSGGCTIVITTGKKSSSRLSGGLC